MPPWTRHGDCRVGCATCCQTLVPRLTVRVTPSITEPAYLAARGLHLDGEGMVRATGALVAPCPQLTPGLDCGIHGAKPQWCRDYPTAPEQITEKPCSYWFERDDGYRVGGLASPYPVEGRHE